MISILELWVENVEDPGLLAEEDNGNREPGFGFTECCPCCYAELEEDQKEVCHLFASGLLVDRKSSVAAAVAAHHHCRRHLYRCVSSKKEDCHICCHAMQSPKEKAVELLLFSFVTEPS
ncbi:hypothetical protein MRB53_002037 [Persea americana]|uniref:Uncharacterized protein n=1 Tax=Persea americana TaxID=3435 RepID=A0ACC2MTH6_PERAE|nr:hypothetical protein MRB53_002037 [Persea americana]